MTLSCALFREAHLIPESPLSEVIRTIKTSSYVRSIYGTIVIKLPIVLLLTLS